MILSEKTIKSMDEKLEVLLNVLEMYTGSDDEFYYWDKWDKLRGEYDIALRDHCKDCHHELDGEYYSVSCLCREALKALKE